MNSKTHYFRIGIFIILSLSALIGGVIAVSSDLFRSNLIYVETYLNESVQGLSVGTPLLHRGVTIGKVEEITFVPRVYPFAYTSPQYAAYSRYVMVIMSIDRKHIAAKDILVEDIKAVLKNQIEKGLRLKLSYQGITGIAYMEADYMDPERNPAMEITDWTPKYLYIPSTKSLITSFTEAVDKVFQRLEKIDFEATFVQMEATLKSIQTTVDEMKMTELRASAVATLDEFKTLTVDAQRVLDMDDPNAPISQFAVTVSQLNRNLNQVEKLINGHEDDFEKILADFKTLTQNLKQLSEQIKMDPAQLFLSSPPKKTEIEK